MNIHTKEFFLNFQTIKTFGRDIYNGAVTLQDANNDHTNLFVEIMVFKKNHKTSKSRKNK